MYLECRDLTKRFQQTVAVDGVSFGVEQGELVSLIGPSGCGKTTTLRLLAGFESPDEGEILLENRPIHHLPPEQRRIGVVFQHFALFPHMTVKNIAYGLRFHKPEKPVRAIIDELLNLMDLQGYQKRKPSQLSAGQQQRVAIARAIAPQPRILLMDEPLSALDAELRKRLRLEIRALQRRLNLTVIHVTHDQEEAMAISDRVIIMRQGRIEQAGEPWQVYYRPATAFVASFVGQANRLPARVVGADAGGWDVHLPGASHPIRLPIQASPHPFRIRQRAWVVIRAEDLFPVLDPPHREGEPGDAHPPGDGGWTREGEVFLGGGGLSPSFPPAGVTLSGRLREVEFLGPHTRLHVELDSAGLHPASPSDAGQGLVALVPSTDLPALRRRVGRPLQLAFHPHRVVVLPASGDE